MQMCVEEPWWVESHDPRYPPDEPAGRTTIKQCSSKAEAIELATELENQGQVIDGIIKTWNAFDMAAAKKRNSLRDIANAETGGGPARVKPKGTVRFARALRRVLRFRLPALS